jgi:O-methyltransferase
MFEVVYPHIAPYTLVTKDRCQSLWDLSRKAGRLPGDMAEVGVYHGGTSMLIASANPHKILHAFDTFSGIPNGDAAVDGHATGDFSDVDTGVFDRLAEWDNIHVHQGLFPDTGYKVWSSYCFANFDGDTYQSCKDFLVYFWPRLVNGGILAFDDYKWHKCLGVEKALVEFGKPVIESVPYQCYICKET